MENYLSDVIYGGKQKFVKDDKKFKKILYLNILKFKYALFLDDTLQWKFYINDTPFVDDLFLSLEKCAHVYES